MEKIEKIEDFNLSKHTLIVMDNFSKFLAIEDTKERKIRITPNWLEFKISGMIGIFDAAKEGNIGFQEFVIADCKKFLDLVSKMGLKDAQFKEPFLYLKNGDTKVKYHTSPLSSIKNVDRKSLEMFDNAENIVTPFELDLNELNNFLINATNTMGYKFIKFETKNNALKIVGFDANGIDNGSYEENLNIKVNDKIDFIMIDEHFSKMIKSNYKVYIKDKVVIFENLDIDGVKYYISKYNAKTL